MGKGAGILIAGMEVRMEHETAVTGPVVGDPLLRLSTRMLPRGEEKVKVCIHSSCTSYTIHGPNADMTRVSSSISNEY